MNFPLRKLMTTLLSFVLLVLVAVLPIKSVRYGDNRQVLSPYHTLFICLNVDFLPNEKAKEPTKTLKTSIEKPFWQNQKDFDFTLEVIESVEITDYG